MEEDGDANKPTAIAVTRVMIADTGVGFGKVQSIFHTPISYFSLFSDSRIAEHRGGGERFRVTQRTKKNKKKHEKFKKK